VKQKLAFNPRSGQFVTDVGKLASGKPKRFYLGTDSAAAQARKLALNEFWGRCVALGKTSWDDESLAVAERLRKGEAISIGHVQGETAEQFAEREREMVKRLGKAVATTAITEADLALATEPILLQRIAALEALMREHLGAGAVEGAAVTVHAALDAYHEYRKATEINPDTGTFTEHVKTEGNTIRLVKRLVKDDMPLSRLSYVELHKWCKALAARPIIPVRPSRPGPSSIGAGQAA
jgi:hypothetical protein